MKNYFKKLIIFWLILCLNYTGILAIHDTFAYFSDTEASTENSFELGTLGFSLSSTADFSPDLTQTKLTSTRTINLNKIGTLGFQYKVKADNINGGLCNYLSIKDNLSGSSFQPLSNFVSAITTFSDTSSLIFTANSSSYDSSLQGEICHFDLVFEGWQENLADNSQGFSDTETIENTIRMGYWDPDIVLNEVLPNPTGQDCTLSGINGEWVEIYNKSANQKDLNGWYLKDTAGHTIPIQAGNTMDNSTIIGANGSGSEWLVVFMNGCILNDDGDTIALYDNNGLRVDAYTYSTAEHNVNNTPDATNNLALYLPFDGNLQDQSGNSNNGTNYGASFTSGKINQGLSFDGSSYVDVGNPNNFNNLLWTYEFWFNTSSSAGYPNLVGRQFASGHGWTIHLNPSGYFRIRLDTDTAINQVISGTTNYRDGNWHFATVILNDATKTVNLYINGILIKTGTYTGNFTTGNGFLRIAGPTVGATYFSGLIDEVKIYNRALSAQEILDHYNASTPTGSVPENKSYARIPDGSSNWVDPYPTPGKPNTLDRATYLEEMGEGETSLESSQATSSPPEVSPSTDDLMPTSVSSSTATTAPAVESQQEATSTDMLMPENAASSEGTSRAATSTPQNAALPETASSSSTPTSIPQATTTIEEIAPQTEETSQEASSTQSVATSTIDNSGSADSAATCANSTPPNDVSLTPDINVAAPADAAQIDSSSINEATSTPDATSALETNSVLNNTEAVSESSPEDRISNSSTASAAVTADQDNLDSSANSGDDSSDNSIAVSETETLETTMIEKTAADLPKATSTEAATEDESAN